jgi:hypothetical protein
MGQRRRVRGEAKVVTLAVKGVDDDDFMSVKSAAHRLQAWKVTSVPRLIARDILEPCIRPDGTTGVTRSSGEKELEWRRTAATWRKVCRGVGGLLGLS